MNRNRKKDCNNNDKRSEFKKDINRDVTQTDQKEAASNRKRSNNRSKNYKYKSADGKYDTKVQNMAWYSKSPAILASASNIPFVSWYGSPIEPVLINNATYPQLEANEPGVSGCLMLDIIPNYGVETKPTDPINLASEKLWSYLFHTVSGQTFADAPDMMMYQLSMCEVYSYIVWLEFLYGLRNEYKSENTYMPRAIITAMGIDYDDIKDHQLDLYGGINTLINQAASLCVPAEFTLFQRRAFMFQNLYTEGLSAKSQLYCFRPMGFYMFGVEATTAQPQMTFQSVLDLWPNGKVTVSELIAFGTNLINSLLANQDVKKLSSLTMRAYGTSGILKLAEMPLNYQTPIIYSLEVLEQIKNATVLSMSGIDETTLIVTQNVTLNCLQYQPKCKNPNLASLSKSLRSKAWQNAYMLLQSPILTTSVANPGPEIIVENSRLMAVGECTSFTATGGGVLTIKAASELCVGMRAINVNASGQSTTGVYAGVQLFDYNNATYDANGINTLLNTVTNAISILGSFKFRPRFRFTWMNSLDSIDRVSGNVLDLTKIGNYDVDNYAVITPNQLKKLDEVIMYELLWSDTVAKAWNGQ